MRSARGPSPHPQRTIGQREARRLVTERDPLDDAVAVGIDAIDEVPELLADPYAARAGGYRVGAVADRDRRRDDVGRRVDPRDGAVEAVGDPDRVAGDGDAARPGAHADDIQHASRSRVD